MHDVLDKLLGKMRDVDANFGVVRLAQLKRLH
jgi:hypothetical protein